MEPRTGMLAGCGCLGSLAFLLVAVGLTWFWLLQPAPAVPPPAQSATAPQVAPAVPVSQPPGVEPAMRRVVSTDRARLEAVVTSYSGPTNVHAGELCAVDVARRLYDDGMQNCHATVRCGNEGRALYGGDEATGFIVCEFSARPLRVVGRDTDTTSVDRDAAFAIDTDRLTLEIDDDTRSAFGAFSLRARLELPAEPTPTRTGGDGVRGGNGDGILDPWGRESPAEPAAGPTNPRLPRLGVGDPPHPARPWRAGGDRTMGETRPVPGPAAPPSRHDVVNPWE